MPNNNAKQTNNNASTSQQDSAFAFLVNKLVHSADNDTVTHLLHALLTEKEQQEIANRIKIFALLQQGLPQRSIREQLSVGIATVSRGAKAYNTHDIATLLPDLQQSLSSEQLPPKK